ncbi:hypothetical protein VPH35_006411 [Triticum aestivum]
MCVLWSFTYELNLHNMSLLLALELLLFLLALPRLTSSSKSTHSSLDRQAEALLQWKSSLYNWDYDLGSWRKETSPCSWMGVDCSNTVPHGRDQGDAALVVSNILLAHCGLQGRLDSLHFADLSHLVYLNLSTNSLSGPIPSSIGALAKLTHLDLSNNGLNGSIPTFLDLPNLVYLDLSGNALSGPIPASIGDCSKLTFLDLSYNVLSKGSIGSIGNLASLQYLYLSKNQINGSIPSTFSKLVSLEELALHSNQLDGQLPLELGSLVVLSHLDLRRNQFVGNIPPQIGQCSSLSYLSIPDNLLTGEIPQQLGDLANLIELDLSRNNLSGAIPATFSNLHRLSTLNLSYNSLAGKVPSIDASSVSLDGNMDLCGDWYDIPLCETHQRRIHPSMVFLAFAPFPLACLTIASIMVVSWRRKQENATIKRKSGDMLSIWNFDGKIAFEDILSATENFNEKFCIGVGGYGSVFRVQLVGGIIFAVKLLHSVEKFSDEETFHAEIEVLTKIRHRSIVRLYGFCSHSQCKFLVYDLIERGSLSSILHEQELAKELDWAKRIVVVTDIAQALSYLHHD